MTQPLQSKLSFSYIGLLQCNVAVQLHYLLRAGGVWQCWIPWCRVNGQHSCESGFAGSPCAYLEKKLGRKLHLIGCFLHINELPLCLVIKNLDGPTKSAKILVAKQLNEADLFRLELIPLWFGRPGWYFRYWGTLRWLVTFARVHVWNWLWLSLWVVSEEIAWASEQLKNQKKKIFLICKEIQLGAVAK